LVPASYYINITRGIILRGAGIMHLWRTAGASGDGTGLILLAANVSRKKSSPPE